MRKIHRILALILVIVSLFTLISCGNGATNNTTNTTTEATPTTPSVTTPQNQPQNQPNSTPTKMLPAQEVKILDQNVLGWGSWDGSTFEQRQPAMAEYMLEILPDSIGLQEATAAWADYMDTALGAKYARVGVDNVGADKGDFDFATYIYYRKDIYKVIATDTFWLSTTPHIPSQEGSVKDANRTCTWVVLENLQTGFRYVHMNCHADHKDGIINALQLQMMRALMLRFEEMGYPVFATGDYNTRQGSFSYEQMVADGKITDARYATTNSDDTVSHFENNANIDYCFITGEKMDVLQFDVIENKHGSVTVSDHNGLYIHAKVKSLPAQDDSTSIPSFDSSIKPTLKKPAVSRTLMDLTVLQARDENGIVAKYYEIEVRDNDGEKIFETTVVSNFYHPFQPRTISAMLVGGLPGETNQLIITPVSILGKRGEALKTEIVWQGEPTIATNPDAADIVDISVVGGAAVDKSTNAFAITQIGNVTLANGAMVFNKGGNLRTPSISEQYAKMNDGFSVEMQVTTGKDITTKQNYVSNQHAGGFALAVENGMLRFAVHNGADYISAAATVEAETTYHVVGIFDGSYIYLYINGNLVSATQFNGSMKNPTENTAKYLCIGADSDRTGQGESHAECKIYHAAIYSQILTDGEVLYLYQNR